MVRVRRGWGGRGRVVWGFGLGEIFEGRGGGGGGDSGVDWLPGGSFGGVEMAGGCCVDVDMVLDLGGGFA